MNLSTRSRYATRAMIQIAEHHGKSPVSLRTIEETQKISRNYLQQLMPPLKNEGLLHVAKGKSGGFMLARPPSEITIGDIIRAQEGEISLVECVGEDGLCDFEGECPSREIWAEASRRLDEYFDSLTLEDVLKTWEKKRKRRRKGRKT
jgi:Rrf2 family protein